MDSFHKKNKRRNSCSYCREEGHNITVCPRVNEDWEYWKEYRVPIYSKIKYAYSLIKYPDNWGRWYRDCQEGVQKQTAYQNRLGSSSKPVKKSCGFCGEPDHNRRRCESMKTFLKDCYTANENWRRHFYEVVVKQHNLSVGAAVKTFRKGYYGSDDVEGLGIITSINFDQLTFLSSTSWDDDFYQNRLKITALVDGEQKAISIDNKDFPLFVGVVKSDNGWWRSLYMKEVITESSTALDESWVTDYKGAFQFLAKKRSYQQLLDDGVVQVVEKWKNFKTDKN